MSAQKPPDESHRRHWRANELGDPVHAPVVEASVCPCCGVPVITGSDDTTGGAMATVVVAAEVSSLGPAVVLTVIGTPASSACSW